MRQLWLVALWLVIHDPCDLELWDRLLSVTIHNLRLRNQFLLWKLLLIYRSFDMSHCDQLCIFFHFFHFLGSVVDNPCEGKFLKIEKPNSCSAFIEKIKKIAK